MRAQNDEDQVVFARDNGWLPRVVRRGDALRLEFVGGADALHDPREFTTPVRESHLGALRDSLTRHLILNSALVTLCDEAGTRGDIDEEAAVALLDPILLGPESDIDGFLARTRFDKYRLIAHGADPELIDAGRIVDAVAAASEHTDFTRVDEYRARRSRTERGVVLAPLDEAILTFTGQLVHRATIPSRNPTKVDRSRLPAVLGVVADAEAAATDLTIARDPRRGTRSTVKADWTRMEEAVTSALEADHPDLSTDTIRSLAFLICSEATDRARVRPYDDDGVELASALKPRRLKFSDDFGSEEIWHPRSRTAAPEAFWEFVAGRSSSDNEVFTLEDTAIGSGIQVHFYADSIARVRTVTPGHGDVDPDFHVEYALVDGMAHYRELVRAFVADGYSGLDGLTDWLSSADELERARRRRRRGA